MIGEDMFYQQLYTINDLRAWSRKEPSLGVVGFPVKHSASPQMQNAALESFEDIKGWHYFRFEISANDFKEALSLFTVKNFIGVNLTLPHKVLAFHLLENHHPSAQFVHAANTLLFDWPGSGTSPEAYSTDGEGLLQGLSEDLDFSPEAKTVLLLGAGGAGQSAAITLEKAGARVLWNNRTIDKVAALIPQLGLENTYLINSDQFDWEEIDLVINATSAGLSKDSPSPIDFSRLPTRKPGLAAYDMLYGKAKTAFVDSAQKAEIPASDGVSMLLHQGAKSFEIWTKKEAPVELMRKALKEALYAH